MFKKSYDIFIKEQNVDENKTKVIFEITLSNLTSQGKLTSQTLWTVRNYCVP